VFVVVKIVELVSSFINAQVGCEATMVSLLD